MSRSAAQESSAVQTGLTVLTVILLLVLLLLPLVVVFVQALMHGLSGVMDAIADPDAIAAIELTLIVAAISVPLNAVCRVAAAWCIGRFRFPGRSLLVTLIELPFSVSPVISGLVSAAVWRHGWLGPRLIAPDTHHLRPGLVLPLPSLRFHSLPAR
jgi:sulfate transport system permease protein